MKSIQNDIDGGVFWNDIPAANDLIFVNWSECESWGGRFEAKSFLQGCVDVFQLLKMLEFYGLGTTDCVDLLSYGSGSSRVSKQVMEEERKHPRCGLMVSITGLSLICWFGPLTSCPAIRNVTNWYLMFTAERPAPVFGSRPFSIVSSKSPLSSPLSFLSLTNYRSKHYLFAVPGATHLICNRMLKGHVLFKFFICRAI
jgi:hypothetical protein